MCIVFTDSVLWHKISFRILHDCIGRLHWFEIFILLHSGNQCLSHCKNNSCLWHVVFLWEIIVMCCSCGMTHSLSCFNCDLRSFYKISFDGSMHYINKCTGVPLCHNWNVLTCSVFCNKRLNVSRGISEETEGTATIVTMYTPWMSATSPTALWTTSPERSRVGEEQSSAWQGTWRSRTWRRRGSICDVKGQRWFHRMSFFMRRRKNIIPCTTIHYTPDGEWKVLSIKPYTQCQIW